MRIGIWFIIAATIFLTITGCVSGKTLLQLPQGKYTPKAVFVDVKYEFMDSSGKLITSCVGKTTKIHVYLVGYGYHIVKVEVVKNIPYFFDAVVYTDSRAVFLNGLEDVVFNFTPSEYGKYFVRVYLDGKRVDPWQSLFSNPGRPEFIVTNYYWVRVRVVVDGQEYESDEYAPIKSGQTVKIYGMLRRGDDGSPAIGVEIRAISVIGGYPVYTTVTGDEGYFEFDDYPAPNWDDYPTMCGEKGRFVTLKAMVSDVTYKPTLRISCTYVCTNQPQPTPTPPTPTPTPQPQPVGCNEPTPHFPSGCVMLNYYDENDDCKIDDNEMTKASQDYLKDELTDGEFLLITYAWFNMSINDVCPNCCPPQQPTPTPTPPVTTPTLPAAYVNIERVVGGLAAASCIAAITLIILRRFG